MMRSATRTVSFVLLAVGVTRTAAGQAPPPSPQAPPAAQVQQATAGAATPEKPPPVPEAKTWVTQHRMTLGGAPLAYTATAGTMLISNDKDEPVALFGYTAYTKDGGDRATRPIVFAYNGGPGSASAWLHMGILGPKRTQLDDLAANTRGPFRTVENEHTILDRATW